MSKRIIHIAIDEKFINSAYKQFEAIYPGRNYFYIISPDKNQKFRFVEQKMGINKSTIPDFLNDVLPHFKKGEAIIFHSFPKLFYPIVWSLPEGIKCVWFCFGFEVYNDVNYFAPKNLLDKITASEFPSTSQNWKMKAKESIRPLVRLMKPNLKLSAFEMKKSAIKKLDYLGSSFDEEFNAILKMIKMRKRNFSFWYYPLEDIVDVSKLGLPGKDIIIGNSGFMSGNHLDVFEKIKPYRLEGKIIVPLSYGISSYIKQIVASGEIIFRGKFHPLTEFYPIEEYNKILSGCGIAILNNKRQQAVGNTIALLWFGSKIFLSKKNPFYLYLKRIGVIVYSYEDDLNKTSIVNLLTLSEVAHNRKMLTDNLGRKRLEIELKASIDEVINEDI